MCPVAEEDTFCEGDESTTMDDTTVIDERYDGLLKIIDKLKDQLIAEKQDKLKMEVDLRAEMCDEFNKMLVEIEEGHEERLKGVEKRNDEMNDWWKKKYEELSDKANSARRKSEVAAAAVDESMVVSNVGDETMLFEKEELEAKLTYAQVRILEVL